MTLNYSIEKTDRLTALVATCDATTATVCITHANTGYPISVYCLQKGSRCYFGKHFTTWAEAFKHYSSPQMRAILTLASEISA